MTESTRPLQEKPWLLHHQVSNLFLIETWLMPLGISNAVGSDDLVTYDFVLLLVMHLLAVLICLYDTAIRLNSP